MALGDHATLEGLASLQLLPSVNGADFHADESLVCILWPEVGGSLGLCDPRVPHDGVFEVVAGDVEEGLAVLQHGGGVLLDGLVDAVGLAGDGNGGVVLGVLGGIEDLVSVGGGAETVDLELGDVLRVSVSKIGPSTSSTIITHITLKVSVQQHLELERLLALVADVQHGLQSILAESHAVHEAELVRPGLPVLL